MQQLIIQSGCRKTDWQQYSQMGEVLDRTCHIDDLCSQSWVRSFQQEGEDAWIRFCLMIGQQDNIFASFKLPLDLSEPEHQKSSSVAFLGLLCKHWEMP